MRIIVDAMGGDNAPQAPVEGALRAVRELGVEVLLTGRPAEIGACPVSYTHLDVYKRQGSARWDEDIVPSAEGRGGS